MPKPKVNIPEETKLTGRPRKNVDMEAILAKMSEGYSLRQSCEGHDITPGTFLYRVSQDDNLFKQYSRARDMCIDIQVWSLNDLEQEVYDSDLSPDKFKAIMVSRQWRAGRMKPKAYGDKQEVNHSSPDGTMSPSPAVVIDMKDVKTADLIAMVEANKKQQ